MGHRNNKRRKQKEFSNSLSWRRRHGILHGVVSCAVVLLLANSLVRSTWPTTKEYASQWKAVFATTLQGLLLAPGNYIANTTAVTGSRLNNSATNAADNHSQLHWQLQLLHTSTNNIINRNATQVSYKSPPDHVYVCGWKCEYFLPLLFPSLGNKLETTRYSRTIASSTSESDFLLFGMHGPCDAPYGSRKTTHVHVQQSFKGTALFLNTEPMGDARGSNTYQIGLVDNSPRSVQVFSVALFVAARTTPENRAKILDPNQKPVNTRERGVIYMASNCAVEYREDAADRISDIAPEQLVVQYGGKCRGQRQKLGQPSRLVAVPGPVSGRDQYQHFNVPLYHKYKYCLVLENSNATNYISEKIALAFMAGCIPIYYGTRQVWDIFNPKAFVFYDIDHPELALEQIRQLVNTSSQAYEGMLAQPILAKGTQTIERFFSLRDDIAGGKLIRHIRALLGYDPNPAAASPTIALNMLS